MNREARAAGRVFIMAARSRMSPWVCALCRRRRTGQCVTARVERPGVEPMNLILCVGCADKMRNHLRRVCPTWTMALVFS